MKKYVKENLKTWEIAAALGALILYVIASGIDVIDGISMGIGAFVVRKIASLIPLIALVVIAFISEKNRETEKNPRVLVWIVVGMELGLAILSQMGMPFRPYMVRCVLGEVIGYAPMAGFLLVALIFIFFVTPKAKNGGLFFCYSLGMCAVYFMAAVLSDNMSLLISSGVLYYAALALFSLELNQTNRLEIGKRLWDYFIGDDVFACDEEDEELNSLLDEIQDEEMENMRKERRARMYAEAFENMPVEEFANDMFESTKQKLRDAVDLRENELILSGSEFLLDDFEESTLMYKIEYGLKTTLSAVYTYQICADEAAGLLKKKSVLNQTFQNIGLHARANVDLNIHDLEEGNFVISLDKCEFENDNFDKVVDRMFEFMKCIILICNAKLYD